MSEFLARISQTGFINHKYFCQDCPAFDQTHSIHTLLNKEDYDRFKKASMHNTNELMIDNISLNGQQHFLYMKQIGHQYLLYVNSETNKQTKKMFTNLIDVIANKHFEHDNHDKQENKLLFENIQKLNNDLVNKQRELSKLNHELNRLNNILNNRLVKDPLTKLVSRYQYRDEILMQIDQHKDTYGLFWFIDVDDFKSINDNYGHKVGDQVLIQIAKRLKTLPFEDTVKMRIAGDEFGLYMANISSIKREEIDAYYQQFKEHVSGPILVDNIDMQITFSVGIAIYKRDTDELHVLIDYADFAMYQAKQKGKNQYTIFNINEYKLKKS